jgi:hypothetical protein
MTGTSQLPYIKSGVMQLVFPLLSLASALMFSPTSAMLTDYLQESAAQPEQLAALLTFASHCILLSVLFCTRLFISPTSCSLLTHAH